MRRLAILILVLAGAAALAWRRAEVREARRTQAIEASRVRGWARANASAGMSVLPKRVPLADDAELRGLADLPGFDAYAMRCASCHPLPDPAAHPAKQWIGTVAKMQEHIREAGVLPPDPAEIEAATAFLGAASDSLRAR